MAKNFNFIRYLLILGCCFSLPYSSSAVAEDNCIISCADDYLHVREATGKNDGPEVEMFLRSVGLGKGYSWCSAFVHYILNECGVRNTVNAWSPTAHNSRNVIYEKGHFNKEVEPGDVFTIYSYSKKRIVHTGFVVAKASTTFYTTIEGNTNTSGSANGDGVYKRRRSFKQTYSITRWRN